jgi:predicted NBD/HSP70 family sugar kinase
VIDATPAWPVLHDAQRAVLVEMIVHGPQPRVELARRLGLSRNSLSRLTRELLDLGFIEEGDSQPRATRGRPPELVNIRKDAAHFLGIKLTGDALYAVVTNLESEVVESSETSLHELDVTSVLSLITTTASDMLRDVERPAAIGVCLAGDVEDLGGTQLIVGSTFLGWDAPVPLARLVAQSTGLPATVSNDVEALTAAHHWFGAGVGRESLVLVAVGAGVGAGIVVGDQLHRGAHARQGKIGHIIVPATSSRRCALGHLGCADALVTMPGIAASAGLGAGQYEVALSRARVGDAQALSAFQDAATALGAIVAQYVNVLDPAKVIITGEGVDMVEFARDRFELALADRLDPRAARSVEIEFQSFRFADYAWGAAITAIRARV